MALLLATVAAGANCASGTSINNGKTGSGGTTGNGTGTAGTTGSSTGVAGTTGTGTGVAGTAGSSTGVAGTTGTGTGVAGTTGTGTAGTTGTGVAGAGGAAVVQKDCATKTVVMSPVFMNFENYTGVGTMTADNYVAAFGGTTVNSGGAYTGFYQYPEVMGGTAPTLAMVGGHPPGNWAGSETLSATTWGMGGGVWMGCANASAYKGISFWVRGTSGTGTFTFIISMESTQLPNAANALGGGTCPGTSDTCVDPSKADIPLTADWTQVQILWSDFTPGISGGTSVVPNGDNIAGMAWKVPLMFQRDNSVAADAAGAYVGVPEALRLDIDDITFTQ